MSAFFLVVCLNPTIQNTYTFPSLIPGQVNRAQFHRIDASGKGVNVARVLAELGEDAIHLTQGGGRHLPLFRELCATDGIGLQIVEGEIEIRACHTLLSTESGDATEIVEPGWQVTGRMEEQVLAAYRVLLSDTHTVIITGSKAPGFSDSLYPTMVADAHHAGIPAILDIRGDDLVASLEQHPTLVKINLSEFSETFGERALPEESPAESVPDALLDRMITLATEFEIDLVVSNGRRPIVYVDHGRLVTADPIAAEPVNPIGSGDALAAGIAAGLHRGLGLSRAIGLGLECAANNLGSLKPGSIRGNS